MDVEQVEDAREECKVLKRRLEETQHAFEECKVLKRRLEETQDAFAKEKGVLGEVEAELMRQKAKHDGDRDDAVHVLERTLTDVRLELELTRQGSVAQADLHGRWDQSTRLILCV
jgi:hypothetical protein